MDDKLRAKLAERVSEELRIIRDTPWSLYPFLPVKSLDYKTGVVTAEDLLNSHGIVLADRPHVVIQGISVAGGPNQEPTAILEFDSWEDMIMHGWVAD